MLNLRFLSSPNRLVTFQIIVCLVVFGLYAFPLFTGVLYTNDDLGAFHIPYRHFYSQCLKNQENFLWCPYHYCGFYLLGEGQAGMLHPYHLFIYKFLPFTVAFNLDLFVCYPMMFLGMIWLLKCWRVNLEGRIFGAFMFTFCGFNTLHLIHMNAIFILAHMPWILGLITRLFQESHSIKMHRQTVAISILTASQILLGYPQYVWISLLCEGIFVLVIGWQTKYAFRKGAYLLGMKLLGFGIGLVQLIPTWYFMKETARDSVDASFSFIGSLNPVNLLQLGSPYLFKDLQVGYNPHEFGIYCGSILMIVLLWIGFRNRYFRSSKRLILVSITLAIVGILLALGKYGLLYNFVAELPLINKFRLPVRHIVLSQFSLAILAALCYQDWKKIVDGSSAIKWRLSTKSKYLILFALLFIFAITLLLIQRLLSSYSDQLSSWDKIIAGPLFFLILCVLLYGICKRIRFALGAIFLAVAIDNSVYGLHYLWQIKPVQFATLLSWAHDYERTDVRVYNGRPLDLLKKARLTNGSTSPGFSPIRQITDITENHLKVANVGYLHIKPDSPNLDNVKSTIDPRIGGLLIPDTFPRARMVSNTRISTDHRIDLNQIDPKNTALVYTPLNLPGTQLGEAKILEERPGYFRIRTKSEERQLLVITESFHKGWHAKVDDVPLELIRVNGDFMGCVIQEGEHIVSLRFEPKHFKLGVTASLISLSMVGLIYCLISKRKI